MLSNWNLHWSILMNFLFIIFLSFLHQHQYKFSSNKRKPVLNVINSWTLPSFEVGGNWLNSNKSSSQDSYLVEKHADWSVLKGQPIRGRVVPCKSKGQVEGKTFCEWDQLSGQGRTQGFKIVVSLASLQEFSGVKQPLQIILSNRLLMYMYVCMYVYDMCMYVCI